MSQGRQSLMGPWCAVTQPLSAVRGVVEPGEALGGGRRGGQREVGIERTTSAMGQQQWPFPNSLMVGLTAKGEAAR